MQGNVRTFFEKGLWVKIGGVSIEYIILFPERIEIRPFFQLTGKRGFFMQ